MTTGGMHTGMGGGNLRGYFDTASPVNSPEKLVKAPNIESSFLTGREIEVMVLAAQGFNNTAISNKLNISLKTIQNYFNAVYSKMDVFADSQFQPRSLAILKWQQAMRDGKAIFLRPEGMTFYKTPYWESTL